MNDTEENDNNDDDGEWEDMPDEDMENMEENWKNMKKNKLYGKKLKNIEQNFLSFTNSRIHEFFIIYFNEGDLGGYVGW